VGGAALEWFGITDTNIFLNNRLFSSLGIIGPINPHWRKVRPRLVPIASRAISTLIKTQGLGDLYRLMAFARRDQMDFNLAALPPDFPPAPGDFNQEYMNRLFDLGFETARNGYPWKKYPPSFEPNPSSGLNKGDAWQE